MTGWLYEDGIGEERAALVEHGRIVEARIQRDDARSGLGAVVEGRLLARSVGGHRARVRLAQGGEAMLQPVPSGLTEGMTVRGEVVREALAEPGSARHKPVRLRPVDPATPLRPPPRLHERIAATGTPVQICHAHGHDRLAESGWRDVMEEAENGIVAFPGGTLIVSPTPGMTVIDVDGDLAPRALALAAADATARAIVRHGIGGGVVIDFPTLTDKADRTAVTATFDAAMTAPCERTAINGFGLMQVVLRRTQPSLFEIHATDPVRWHLLAALRSAERDTGTGALHLSLAACQAQVLARHPEWRAELERRTGRFLAD